MVLVSDRGLCGLEFINGDAGDLLTAAKARWPRHRVLRATGLYNAIAGVRPGVGPCWPMKQPRKRLLNSLFYISIFCPLTGVFDILCER